MIADTAIPCPMCSTWHDPPRCAHDVAAVCVRCGRPVGFLAQGQPRDGVCWRCHAATQGIVVPEIAPVGDFQDDRFAEMFREPDE